MTPEIYKSMKDTLVNGSYIFFEGCSTEHDYIYRFFKYRTKTMINGDLFISKHYDEMETGEHRHAAYVFITFIKINEAEQITVDEGIELESAKKHWFVFSYAKLKGFVSSISAFDSKEITLDRININRRSAQISSRSTLLSCSYLGFMTEEEFKSKG